MHKSIQLLILITLAILAGTNVHAHSYRSNWQINGMGCVPAATSGSLDYRDLMFSHGGGVTFKQGKLGSIVLDCSINSDINYINTILLSYRDSTGEGRAAKVTAVLRRVSKSSGAAQTITIGSEPFSISSDSFPVTGFTAQVESFGSESGIALNHDKFYYYVQVSLSRRQASDYVKFVGVELLRRVF